MKKIILGLCLITTTGLIYAAPPTNTKVPGMVKSAFRRDYKGATAIQWDKVDGKWTVNFNNSDNVKVVARYDWTGHHVDSQMPVTQSEVPGKVITELKDKYPEKYGHTFTMIRRPWKKDLYMVKVKDKGAYKPLYLDKNGHEHDYASR